MALRPIATTRRTLATAALGLGLTALAGGCDPRTLIYFLQPFEPKIEPPGPSLKGKKVVILTHASLGATGDFPDLEADISKGVARRLEDGVKKLEVVPHSKVKVWADGNPAYTDPSEAGRAFNADAVIFLEIEGFQIESPLSPGLFQGESLIHVKVFDLTTPTDERGDELPGRDKEVIVSFDDPVETAFPRTQGAMPIGGSVVRSAFKKKFMDVVITELSWQFIPHPTGDMIQDTTF